MIFSTEWFKYMYLFICTLCTRYVKRKKKPVWISACINKNFLQDRKRTCINTRLISICKCTTGFGVYITIINQKLNHIETGMHHSPGCKFVIILFIDERTTDWPQSLESRWYLTVLLITAILVYAMLICTVAKQ